MENYTLLQDIGLIALMVVCGLLAIATFIEANGWFNGNKEDAV